MSLINPSLIDATFPIAGQDNDSQGFRTNSANIVTNFTYAENEITDLQNKVILKAALTEVGTLNNNFAGALMSNALIQGFGEVILDNGVVSGSVALSYANGSFQRITPSSSVTLALNSWCAAGNLGKMRLEVVVTSTAFTLTLPASVSLGTSGILGLSGSIITFPSTGNYLYEFSSFDGGNSYFILDLLNNRTTSSGSLNAIAASSINANVTALGSQPSAPAGTLFRMTNIDGTTTRIAIDSYVNSGNPTSGVSMRGARGTAGTPTAVQNTDFIGSISAHGYGATTYQAGSTGMLAFAAEGNFTDTSQPTAITFQTTPNNSIVKSEALRLTSMGVLLLNGTSGSQYTTGTPSTSTTTGSLVVTGGVGISGALYVGGTITGSLSGGITSSSATITGGAITGTSVTATTTGTNVVSVTGTYAVSSTDGTVFCNLVGGAFTVTLPLATTTNKGRIIRVFKTDTGTNALTVAASGSESVNGNPTIATSGAGPIGFVFQSDGNNWWNVG